MKDFNYHGKTEEMAPGDESHIEITVFVLSIAGLIVWCLMMAMVWGA